MMESFHSDPTLVTEVRQYGSFDTNACLQCGSCTVICNLTDQFVSFPRRVFRFTLLGLRQPLKASLEPWLCYYCGDCSQTCPRQTEPAEAMMTLRRYLTAEYDWTGLAAKIYRSRTWEIMSLFATGVLVILLIIGYHLLKVKLALNEFLTTEMGLEHMFNTIRYFTLAVFFLPLLFLSTHAYRMYRFTFSGEDSPQIPFSLFLSEARTLLWHSLTQVRFRECEYDRRWILHMALVVSCVVMIIFLIFFLGWFQTDNLYPLYHPQRWLGYLITLVLVYVPVDILISRFRKKQEIHRFSHSTDLTFPILLLLTALSGISVHILRYAGLLLASHYAYAIHIAIVVPLLVIEIPFGKWSHMIYRPLAIYFQSIKEKALQRQEVPV